MSSWKEYKIGQIVSLEYGKGLRDYRNGDGLYDVFGTNGQIGKTNSFLFDHPSVIIGRKGAYRGVHLAKRPSYVIDTAFYTKNKIDELDTIFLYYWFKNVDINDMDSGSAIPSTSRDEVYELEIELPPLSEQKAIASILGSLDDKIDLLHRQNATLEAMAETLFRQWFVESEYDRTVGDLVSVESGYAFKSKDFREMGSYRVLKIKNISNGLVDTTNTDFVDEEVGAKVQEKFKVVAGDILIAMTGAEIGKLGIVPGTNERLLLNQRVGLLRERYSGSGYLAYIQLKSEFGRDYIDNAATGSAQPNISAGAIQRCPFPDVSDAKLKNYSSQLSPVYAKLVFNLGQIRTLQAIRDALLPRLMSGEITIL